MGFHHGRLIILVALATMIIVESSSTTNVDPSNGDPGCSLPADINNDMLAQKRDRYISYAALAANNIPCGWRGSSYYDCSRHQRVNPYRRGCTAATGCFRWTH
ncbi:Protein RALF-like 19 [Linum grandiflorum]